VLWESHRSRRHEDRSTRTHDRLEIADGAAPVLNVFEQFRGDDDVEALRSEDRDEVLYVTETVDAWTLDDVDADITAR